MTTKTKAQRIQKLVAELEARTKWAIDRQPPPSTFHIEPGDFRYTHQPRKSDIEVLHRDCGGSIIFDANEIDPHLNQYVCYRCFSAASRWLVSAVKAMTYDQLQVHFYVVLREKEEDLQSWPIKLCDETKGKVTYTTTRILTQKELLESRVKRLFAIREAP